ncbi:MAG: hypothetical protein IPK16_22800 [Anaerolineales bacterium]|nr:hypothetical protein [Anaerolineales bacterium]
MSPAKSLVLAVDQGTTNTKAILVDPAGQVVGRASVGLSVTYPQPSWVEQDAAAIWQSVQKCIDDVLAAMPTGSSAQPVALGISNQRNRWCLGAWSTGEPLAPA